MKIKNTFYLFLLFLTPLSILGQTMTLGGNAYATVFKNEQKNSFSPSKDNNVQAFLTPNYSVFLNKKLMVGGGITVGGFHNQNKITDFWYSDFKSFSGAIAPSIRYYFFDKSKWRTFGSFRFEYSGSKGSALLTDLTGTYPSKSTSSAWNYVPTIGANYFFSDDLALEFSISHSQTHYKAGVNKSAFNISGLNAGFQNFLTLKPKMKKNSSFKKEAPPQYLQAKKWLVGGNALLWRFSQGTHFSKDLTLTLNPEIGYFLTKNIVLGTSSYVNAQKNSDISWNIEPFVRFYQPVFSSFSIFAEGRMGFYNSQITDFKGIEKTVYLNQSHLSLGYNYFLSQRVALEGAFYHFSYLKQKEPFERTNTNHEFGFQARIRYFLN